MSDFFAWLEPVALGALGAVIGWITAEFVGKPVRAFFDLKKECIETLIHFGNVSALPVELRSNMFRPRDPQVEAIKKRLADAREAFRKCGSRLQAFAETETLAVVALGAIGYKPREAGRGFIGLSASIGDEGATLHGNRVLIEHALRMDH
ncbi:hypothetical protein [Bradyrhizobium arachidis]|uniref:Uncharacterized protein n=1 Tax=Bradyrhizobium arachidis TaxID=858423 RepID=A0AAE7NKE3_9BRAD|nr:hypothetical protein [Bradyrhizobium arachidis]QOZ66587.1 hypothetical protein WN72_09515 [Bradyrhizobium arachidis]